MKRSASPGMCSPRSAKNNWISAANSASSGCSMRDDRRDREPGLEVGQLRRPGRRHLVRDHDQRPAAVLRLVPGVEQLLLVALLGLVEQPPADALDEAARKQRAARAPRAGQDRRLDRPQAPLAEMLERLAVGVGDDEAGVASLCGQSSGSAIWSGPLLHCWRPAAGCRLAADRRSRLRRSAPAAAAAAAACPLDERIFTTVPRVIDDPAARAERRRRAARCRRDRRPAHSWCRAGLISCGVAESIPASVRRCAIAKL